MSQCIAPSIMPQTINRATVLGVVVGHPQFKGVNGGSTKAAFTVATEEQFKDRSGRWRSRTDCHDVVAWNRLAIVVQGDVRSGSRIYVEGRLRTSNWEDREGRTKENRTEIIAQIVILLPGNRGGIGEAMERAIEVRSGSSDSYLTEALEPEELIGAGTIPSGEIPF
jgi:single-strand DNA-binding protein